VLKFIFRKILYGLTILLGVVTLIFTIFNILPGDPARMTLGQRSDSASLAAVHRDLGLDKPVFTRYIKYLNDLSPLSFHNQLDVKSFFYFDTLLYKPSIKLFSFNITAKPKIGSYNYSNYPTQSFTPSENKYIVVVKFPYLRRSYQQQRNVSDMIIAALPPTFVLAILAIIIAAVFGIAFGIIAALKKDTWIDRTLLTISSFGISLPSFFVAIIFAWLFAYVLGPYTHLPISGNLYEWDDFGEGRKIILKNAILPAITLGIRPLAVVMQLMRNSLLEVLSQDYITTARSKGLSEYQVIFHHALKNSLNPVVTSLSSWFASMLTGVVFIEYIFSWKGLGYLLVNALQDFDLPVVMGGVLIISIIFIIVNIFTDIAYAFLDPKIQIK
jgi:peptide/nickel transport system permease protein